MGEDHSESITANGTGPRLTLRSHPPPQPWAVWLALAGAGLVVAGLLLRTPTLTPLLGVSGILAALPLLWGLRPGPVTVIDRRAGRIEERNALGRVCRSASFGQVERVTCDHITLPSSSPDGPEFTIYRTLLITADGPVTVCGFGAPGPARKLKTKLEQWLPTSPTSTP
ncbi:DUF4175 domain-containing protein [Oceanicola sp. D3]|uniref:DUF4175 domain-containing protein n=1 Tax=Oceanicola sp. D3 TaxID=2587163 RepID=UPI00111E8CC8|nr:DUF4175 domain-containing protein [Oceanicola sp. D3]QDC10958.1 DUF4175 domain-containing protein [Oceanicola sp. D3]